jgi:GNAT superfamily N-acetyltransferase
MKPVPPDSRELLRPLFRDFPGMHGVIDSVIEGFLGQAYTDDPAAPRVAHLILDFYLIAGDPEAPHARETLASLPSGEHVAVPEAWEDLLVEVGGEGLQPYDRFAYHAPARWDRSALAAFRDSTPDGFTLERITADTVDAFANLSDSLIYNFESPEDFLTRGVGFGLRAQEPGEDSRFVSGCSSYAISSRSLEFEIQTHPDYQRRGFALITGARMIEHCIDTGLEPCWDAAHEGSARLAERLGFADCRPYTAYRLS